MFIRWRDGGKWGYLHLIVVTSPQIDHDVLVTNVGEIELQTKGDIANYEPIEEHNGAGIVQLIHLNGSI